MVSTSKRLHPWRTLLALGVSSATMLTAAQSVGASPIEDKRAEATALAKKIEAQGEQVSIAAENANKAKADVSKVSRDLVVVKTRTSETERETNKVLENLRSQATNAYVTGPTSRPKPAGGSEEPLVKAQYVHLVTGQQAGVLDQAKSALAKVKDQRIKLTAAEKRAKETQSKADKAARDADRAEEDAKKTLAGVRKDLEQLVNEERERVARENAERAAAAARAAADAQARAAEQQRQNQAQAAARAADQRRQAQAQPLSRPAGAAPVSSAVPSKPAPATPSAPSAPSSGAGAAVAFALSQQGKPYRWGAEGPGSYDCSGLTLAAWRSGGKSLGHFTGAQYDQTTKISVNSLQPGDLVFFGSYPFHHVGMYIGNGNMVHAPRTGDVVKIVPLSARRPSAATRP